MSALIFKIFLPVLLGYTLFVGLSGRFNPLSKPSELERRPDWMLGSWIGLSVTLVTGIVLQMAFQLPLEAVKSLVRPTGLLLAALVLPGMVAYLVYAMVIRQRIKQQTAMNLTADEITYRQIEEIDFDDALVVETVSIDESAVHDAAGNSDEDFVLEAATAESATALNGQDSDTFATDNTVIAFEEVVDSGDNGSVSLLFDSLESPIQEQTLSTGAVDALTDNAQSVGAGIKPAGLITLNATSDDSAEVGDAQTANVETAETNTTHADTKDLNTVTATKNGARTETVSADAAQETAQETASVSMNDKDLEALKTEIANLKRSLDTESSLRSHAETHLRITRKALKTLEGDTRDFESDKADALMVLEEELETRIKEVAAAQARAKREETSRIEAETTIVNMKQDMLDAKRELRRNTEARAKALETANKSVSFARQSVQARTRAEARIKQLESRLKLGQETVSSLIVSLDKEKARTQANVIEMAKELILQQKRINEKRTLDEASRRTQERLSRRSAKKVS